MAGSPIYLVSACSSGEEFVAAFRRYADRNGVIFVPIAEPLPPGQKGRFALTLKDGGVMVEGDAEVVSSARTPSVLYGRIGMTLKFLVPDEPSKTILTELEKARLALKPSPPTIAPRPAEVPAEPRPRPPVPTGRIDSVNALAECVAIGEGVPAPGAKTEAPPKNPGPKFVVPSVPSIPAGRPRTPSTPGQPPPKPGGTIPPPIKPQATPTTIGVAPLAKPGSSLAPAPSPTATTLGVAPLEKPADSAALRSAVAATAARREESLGGPGREKINVAQTLRGPAPGVDLTATGKADLNTTMRGTKPAPSGAARGARPASTPPPIPQRSPTPSSPLPVAKQPRMATPFAPMPIVQQPAPPIVAEARPALPEVEVNEPTDLTSIPQVDDSIPDPLADSTVPVEVPHEGGSAPVMIVAEKPREVPKPEKRDRRTVMGVAVVPSGVMVLPAAPAIRQASEEESRDTSVMDAAAPTGTSSAKRDAIDSVDALSATLPPQPPLPPSVVRPTVEEPTPSGDWTMTPGVDGPTITPTPRDKSTAKPAPPGPTTGDWMIALDPSQPDGWSEPSKVEKRPEGELPPGPPESVVFSARPLDSNKRLGTEPVISDAGPKIQIDPTLIEPLTPMPALDADDDAPLPPPPSTAHPVVGEDGLMPLPMQHVMPGPMPGSYVTPPVGQPHLGAAASQGFVPQRNVTDAGSGFFRESGDIASYASGPELAIPDPRRKRLIVIIASAVAVAVVGIILLLALGGGKDDKAKAPEAGGSTGSSATIDTKPDTARPDETDVAVITVDAAAEPAEVVDAVAPAPDTAVASIPATDCKVAVTSVPSGAEIVIDKNVVGTTPAALTLPCGTEAKLVVRKTRFASQTRTVTPNEASKPIRVNLQKVTFSVKVSSTPPGASITVGKKSMGFTPTTVRLPAYETSTLKLAKDGFTPDTQKITPKQNNQAVHAKLKRAPKRR